MAEFIPGAEVSTKRYHVEAKEIAERGPAFAQGKGINTHVEYKHYADAAYEANKVPRSMDQPELPFPGGVGDVAPHNLSRSQFGNHINTWWRSQDPKHGGGEGLRFHEQQGGIHVGTKRAATEINMKGGLPGDRPEHYHYPVQIQGPVTATPERPAPDEGYPWKKVHQPKLYGNVVEHPGSISAVSPVANVKTHPQIVQDAIARGEDVHPAIRWEAEHAPAGWSEKVSPYEAPSRYPESISAQVVGDRAEERAKYRPEGNSPAQQRIDIPRASVPSGWGSFTKRRYTTPAGGVYHPAPWSSGFGGP